MASATITWLAKTGNKKAAGITMRQLHWYDSMFYCFSNASLALCTSIVSFAFMDADNSGCTKFNIG